MSDEALTTLLIARKNSLRNLHFNGLSINDETFELLSICQPLEELGISNAEYLLHSGVTAISRLRNLKILKLINARNVAVTDFIFAFSEKKLKNLVQLDLSRCLEIDNEVLETIAKNCPNLESLTLNGLKKITDDGMIFLITYCKKIRSLNLRRIDTLTDKFLSQINDNLPKLRFLNIRNHGPKITKMGVEDLINNSESHRFVLHEWKSQK